MTLFRARMAWTMTWSQPSSTARCSGVDSRPLPELLVLNAPPLVVLSRLQVAPGEARLRLGESTPLHLAVEEGCDHVIVQAILALNNAAVAKANDDGQLPLHLAASHGAGERVVAALLAAHQDAAACPDEDGRLPLHYAAEHGAAIGPFLRIL